MTDRGSPLIVGQTLTRPLFNEPMWVEAVQSNRTTSWIVGLVRTSSKRFLLTGNCNPVSPSGSRKKPWHGLQPISDASDAMLPHQRAAPDVAGLFLPKIPHKAARPQHSRTRS